MKTIDLYSKDLNALLYMLSTKRYSILTYCATILFINTVDTVKV